MSGPAPDFVIIGAQKSGSTALMRFLGDHPQVFLPEQETQYFRDPWFQFQSADVLTEAVATDDRAVLRRGIKCPDYLAAEAAPGRIQDVLGSVQTIAVLRDPVDRAVSAYYWAMQWGWAPRRPLVDGMSALLDGRVERDYPRSAEILDYGRYGHHLRRWVEQFGQERVRVLLDEDLRPDVLGATLLGLFQWLGVDPEVAPAARDRRVNAGVYSPVRLKLLSYRFPYILREFPGYPGRRYLQPAVGLRGRVVNRTVSVIDRVVLARLLDNRRPEVPPDLTARLRAWYRDDLLDLEQLLGRRLDRWVGREHRPSSGPAVPDPDQEGS